MKRRRGPHPELQRWRRALAGDAVQTTDSASLCWARAVVQGARDPAPDTIDPALAQALVDTLVAQSDVDGLSWLAGLDQRGLAKAARTGAHRLRTRGVDVDLNRSTGSRAQGVPHRAGRSGDEPARPPAPTHGERTISEGIVTRYDHYDTRVVWVAQAAPGGLSWLRALVSPRRGLVQLTASLVTRKTYRGGLKELRELAHSVVVDVDAARWFIHEAARRTKTAGRALSDEALRALRELGPVPTMEHPALALEATEQDPKTLLELYELPALALWSPDQETLQQVALGRDEVQTSSLLINDGQRAEQTAHALDRHIDRYFADDARRSAAQHVLLDTAQLVQASGDMQRALQLRAAAALFELPRARLLAHPFVRQFILRWCEPPAGAAQPANLGMDDAPDEAADETADKSKSSLILLP